MENTKITKFTVLSNLIWRFAERTGAQLVSFVVSMVIARILEPEAFGVVSIITVFINILQVFIDNGLGTALVQKKDADDLDFSTAFFSNIAICILLYSLLFFAAPIIEHFYEYENLVSYIRVLSIVIIISGIKNVQQAYVSRNLIFKRFFFATLGGTIGAGVLGIVMALNGFGVWALIAQHLFNTTVDTIILWITVKWRPKKMFSFKRLKGLFSFGWKLVVSSLIESIYSNLRQMVIGKIYSPSDLAFYNRGKQFPDTVCSNINSSIDSVLFPSMSKKQDNSEELKKMTRMSIKTSTYVMAPLMMGLAFTANNVVNLILTDKWAPCIPFLRIFCITLMFYPIHTANLNAIKALGRSDIFLKLEVIKKIVGIILLLSTMWISVMAMAYSMLVSTVLSMIINTYPNWKMLKYTLLEQLKDIMPGILLAIFMGACILPINLLHIPTIVILIIQIIMGGVIYIGLSALLKLESFRFLFGIVKTLFDKYFGKKTKKD